MNKAGSRNVRNQLSRLAGSALDTAGDISPAQTFAFHRQTARDLGRVGRPNIASIHSGQQQKQLASEALRKTAAMDRELAGVVLEKWASGAPVSETNLYKAAQALDIDPVAALVEARFYTYLDDYLSEKRAMSRGERAVFSAAASLSDNVMTKTASAYGLSPDELIIEALRERGFVPDLQKIANLSAVGGDPTMTDPAALQQQQAGQAMMGPPQPDAMVQQQPQAGRFKPSPTGPEQSMAVPGGNLDELVQQGQQVFGDQAMGNGGTAPQGMPEPPPEPPSPEERIQQVGPNLDPETVARYAEQLARFEEGFQMQITDPKQMVKFVKELQKVDGKKVDQGIKAMGQQLEQEQAQELGVDATPTIDGPGGAGGAGGGPGMGMAPKPGGAQAAPGPQEGAPQEEPPGAQSGGPQNAGPPQAQPKKQPPPQPAAGGATEKVAHAARVLARALHAS